MFSWFPISPTPCRIYTYCWICSCLDYTCSAWHCMLSNQSTHKQPFSLMVTTYCWEIIIVSESCARWSSWWLIAVLSYHIKPSSFMFDSKGLVICPFDAFCTLWHWRGIKTRYIPNLGHIKCCKPLSTIFQVWSVFFYLLTQWSLLQRGRRGREQMVVGTFAISAYHNWCCKFESRSGQSVQHYVIKFVSDLRQVGDLLQVLWFLPPIKLIR
jgi:hypothetical protein